MGDWDELKRKSKIMALLKIPIDWHTGRMYNWKSTICMIPREIFGEFSLYIFGKFDDDLDFESKIRCIRMDT